jgi:hypothetical protein
MTKMAKQDITKLAADALSAKQAKAEHARLHGEISAHDKRYYQETRRRVGRRI